MTQMSNTSSFSASFQKLREAILEGDDFQEVYSILGEVVGNTEGEEIWRREFESPCRTSIFFSSPEEYFETLLRENSVLAENEILQGTVREVFEEFQSWLEGKIERFDEILGKSRESMYRIFEKRESVFPVSLKERQLKLSGLVRVVENVKVEVLSKAENSFKEYCFEEMEKWKFKKEKTRARKLPQEAIDGLKKWFVDNFDHPYPTGEEKEELCTLYNLTPSQLNNWFINARVRTWRPLMKKIGASEKLDARSQQKTLAHELERKLDD